MTIRFPCEGCKRQLSAPEALAGRPAQCPHCGCKGRVPNQIGTQSGSPAPIVAPTVQSTAAPLQTIAQPKLPRFVIPAIAVSFGLVAVLALLVWAPWQGARETTVPVTVVPPPQASNEMDQLRTELAAMKAEMASRAQPAVVEPAKPTAIVAPSQPEPSPVASAIPQPTIEPQQSVLANMVKIAKGKVVRLDVVRSDGAGVGSGFVANADGMVVTNFHVAEAAERIEATFANGEKRRVIGFLAVDPDADVAILQVEAGAKPYEFLHLTTALPSDGDQVFAIGSPQGFSFSVTDGIVSGSRIANDLRTMRVSNQLRGSAQLIQTSTPISPGNSGGPLLGLDGKVIGINTLGVNADFGQNLNFAVASVEVERVIRAASKQPQALALLPRRAPSKLDVATVPTSSPADDTALEQQLRQTLTSIYEQRKTLFAQKATLELRLSGLERDLAVANGEMTKLSALATPHTQAIRALQQQIGQLNQQVSFTFDALEQQRIRDNIATLQSQGIQHENALGQLQAQANGVTTTLAGLNSQREGALREMQSLYDQADRLRQSWLTVVDPYGEQNNNELRLAILTEWIALDSEFAEAFLNRGYLYLRLDQLDAARSDFATAQALLVKSHPAQVWQLQLGLAYASFEMGKPKTCREIIAERVYKYAPNSPPVLHLRGLAYLTERDYARALPDLRKAAEKSTNPRILADAAWALAICPRKSLRNSRLAEDYARRALDGSKGTSWRAMRSLAAALAENGKYPEARSMIEKAMAIAPAKEKQAMVNADLAVYLSNSPLRMPDDKD